MSINIHKRQNWLQQKEEILPVRNDESVYLTSNLAAPKMLGKTRSQQSIWSCRRVPALMQLHSHCAEESSVVSPQTPPLFKSRKVRVTASQYKNVVATATATQPPAILAYHLFRHPSFPRKPWRETKRTRCSTMCALVTRTKTPPYPAPAPLKLNLTIDPWGNRRP